VYLACGALLACTVFFNAQASQVLSLSIKDAVELTTKNNTKIKIAEAAYERELAKRGGVWSAVLPEVEFKYEWTRQKLSTQNAGDIFEGNDHNIYNSGLEFTQPLLDGGKLWHAPAAQRAFTEKARLEAEIEKRTELFNMAESYFSLLLYQEQLQTLQRQFEAQSKLIRQARQRYRMGAERELTVLQFETQSALLRPQIIEAESNLQTEAVRLLNFLGKADVSSVLVKGNLEGIRKYRAITASEARVESLPELRVQYENLRGLDASRAVIMAEHWPKLSLVGRWGQSAYTRSELFSPNNREWSYGLNLSVPLFSGFSSFSKRRELAAETAEARYQEKAARDTVAIELVQREKSLRTSSELIEAKKLAFDLAQRSYQKAAEMFRFGTLTYREFFDIERDLISAELSYYDSLKNHLTVVMQFHVSTGQDLQVLLESLDEPGL
jgi:outer membrane protein